MTIHNIFFLILLFSQSLLADNFCPQDASKYGGEKIVFLDHRIDYSNECIRGRGFISAYCATNLITSNSKKYCDVGKVLACRFCKPERTPICNYDHLPLKNFESLGLDAEECRSLEETPAGFKKIVLTYDQVCSKRSDLLTKTARVKANILALSTVTLDYMKDSNNADSIYNDLNQTSDEIAGEKGFLEILDTFGHSDTILDLRRKAADNKSAWDSVVAQALSSRSMSEDDFRAYQNDLRNILELYTNLEMSFSELAYKAEGMDEALACN